MLPCPQRSAKQAWLPLDGWMVPSSHTENDGKSQFLMGKSTISMAIFNSKLFHGQSENHMDELEVSNP